MHYRGIMRTASTQATAIALASAAAVLSSCRTAPEVAPPDPAIVGTWRAASGLVEVDFSPSGLYLIRLDDMKRPVMGAFAFDAKEGTLTLTTRRESPACGDDNASYRVIVGGMSMDLEVVRDTCDLRAKAFKTRLERVGAKR